MKKRALGLVMLSLVTLLGACGGKSSDKGTTSSPSTATAAMDGKLPCGKDICSLPDDLKGETLCCMDAFKGGCGVKAGSSCRTFPTVDARCPVPDIQVMGIPGTMDVKSYGCCTDQNACGIDFGMGGCQPRTFLCQIVTPDQASSINPQTCDGESMPLPDPCGRTGRGFPGAAGGGMPAAGSGM